MNTLNAGVWSVLGPQLVERHHMDDDPLLWKRALEHVFAETAITAQEYSGKDAILVDVGRCSHWIRPHWRTRAGTAWPYGYDVTTRGYGFRSIPAHDWSFRLMYDRKTQIWTFARGQVTRRPLVQRISVPARTARHPQATVHTIWTPGNPCDVKRKLELVYGFEKVNDDWACVASWAMERS